MIYRSLRPFLSSVKGWPRQEVRPAGSKVSGRDRVKLSGRSRIPDLQALERNAMKKATLLLPAFLIVLVAAAGAGWSSAAFSQAQRPPEPVSQPTTAAT